MGETFGKGTSTISLKKGAPTMTLEKRTSTMKDKKQAPSYKSVHILTQKVNSPNTDCEISMMIRMRSSASIHGNERVIC